MAKYICLIFILFVNLFQVFGLNSEINGSPIISTIYYMAVKNGNTLLLDFSNKGISESQSDGKLSEIQIESKLNEKNYNKLDLNTSIITLGLIIAILLIILGFIWIWYLYLQIKKKTKSLDLKNQELQKSEEKFRIITENSTDVIYQLDSSFNLTYISASDEELRGYKKEEIMGDSLFSILKPEGIELIMKANKKRMIDYSNGAIPAPLTYEVEELCKDGSWVWVEATASAYFDKDGKISGYMGVSRDITERRKNEQLLNEKESQLRELISTKDKLFSIS
jgi:PAS domain S-box-containing protein